MTRDEAWLIVCEFVQSDSLRRHMLAVEACVVAYARKFGADENEWAVTALLHDFDWEIHPAAPDHPMKGETILAGRGVSHVYDALFFHTQTTAASRASRCLKRLFSLATNSPAFYRVFVREAGAEHL